MVLRNYFSCGAMPSIRVAVGSTEPSTRVMTDPIAVTRQAHAAAVEGAIAIAETHQAILAERPLAFVPAGGLRHAHDPAVRHVVLGIVVTVSVSPLIELPMIAAFIWSIDIGRMSPAKAWNGMKVLIAIAKKVRMRSSNA